MLTFHYLLVFINEALFNIQETHSYKVAQRTVLCSLWSWWWLGLSNHNCRGQTYYYYFFRGHDPLSEHGGKKAHGRAMSVNEEENEEEEGRKHIIDQYKEELESKNGRCEF